MELALPALAFDVKQARSFIVSTASETGKLSQPVVLELPKASNKITVVELVGGSWQIRKAPLGPTTHIEIAHFSKSIFGVLEWFSATNVKLEQTLEEAGNSKDPIKFGRKKIERDTDDVKAFYGVGESGGRPMHENCAELRAMLDGLTDPKQFEMPVEILSPRGTEGGPATLIFTARSVMDPKTAPIHRGHGSPDAFPPPRFHRRRRHEECHDDAARAARPASPACS